VTGWAGPLVTGEGCRLAEGADVVVAHLRPDTPESAAILDAHRVRWPDRLSDQGDVNANNVTGRAFAADNDVSILK
jgi:hypothetical protein